jgi:hypothetical protein
MKKSLILLILSVILVCCTNKETNTTNIQKDTVAAEPKQVMKQDSLKKDARKIGPEKSQEQLKIEAGLNNIKDQEDNSMLGCWVGSFGQTKINVFIASIEGSEISGHSVCAGNFRAISGEIKEKSKDVYTAEMKEPGDNKYDGKFQFTIDKNNKILEGSWTPFDTKATSSKKYSLSKKVFKYNPNAGNYPEGSTKLLDEEYVSNFRTEDLKMMRNEIYARHGYSFKNKEIRKIFDQYDWYFPVCVDVRDYLTDTEVKNIDLIYKYEKYYEESYDDYGR